MVLILYIVSIILTIIYFITKYSQRHFLFSPFNISVFMYLFTLFVVPLTLNENLSWYALGITNASIMRPYLMRNMVINLVGYIVYIISAYFIEFGKNYFFSYTDRMDFLFDVNMKDSAIRMLSWFLIIAWYIIVFLYNGGIPLLNGGRTFYLDSSISPIYLFLNEVIQTLAIVVGVLAITNGSNKCLFVILCITLMGTGNRGSILLSVIYPIIVMWLYIKEKQKKKKVTKQILLMVLVLGIAGLGMAIIRNDSGSLNMSNILQEFMYGNSFSDIRDGALVIKGWIQSNMGFIRGKTYLAGLISFIPSSLSSFREKWSWGGFSTKTLLGWPNHTGLRGGNVLESYINFSWCGVIISAIMQGYFMGLFEKKFYEHYIENEKGFNKGEIISIVFLQKISYFFVCSAGNFGLYAFLIWGFMVIFLSAMLGNKKIKMRI